MLTWNLKHGRSVPSAGHDLFDAFAAALEGWEWDSALLQEVPPWWPAPLARRLAAEERLVLTSRNAALPVRRALAVRWPDAIKSNGGGCNAILVRGAAIGAHRVMRLSLLAERRWVHAVALQRPSLRDRGQPSLSGPERLWLANLHTGADPRQAIAAAAAVREWAGAIPALLGGDFNLRDLSLDGFEAAGGYGVDRFYVRGLRVVEAPAALERGRLSDHAPVLITVAA